MPVGTPEHDAYLRELMQLPSQRVDTRAICPDEQEWRAAIVELALEAHPNDPAKMRELIRATVERGPILPELTLEQRRECLRRAVQCAWVEHGEPATVEAQALFDATVDKVFSASLSIERERNAPAWMRARAQLKRLELLPGFRKLLGLEPIK